MDSTSSQLPGMTEAIPLTSSLPVIADSAANKAGHQDAHITAEALPALPMESPPAPPAPSRSPFVNSKPPAPAVTPPAVPPPTPPAPATPPQIVYTPAPPTSSGGSGCLWVYALLVTFALVGAIMLLVLQFGASGMDLEGEFEDMANKPKPIKKFSEAVVDPGKKASGDRIVRIDVSGPIFSGSTGGGFLSEAMPMVDTVKRSLAQAAADSKVKAIVVYVDSPGGEVTASENLYHAVKQAREKKPVVVFMDSVAASGGYYLSAPATKIIANETTLTGSIGVIMQGYAYHGLFDKVGMSTNTFTSGKFKDTLSGSRPMRDDERAYIQGMVDQMYDRFLTVVSEGRKIDKDTLRNGIADGRVMGGRDALAAKLVDQLGYVEDAYTAARELGKCPDATVVRYRQQVSIFDALGVDAEASAEKSIKLQVPGMPAMTLQPGRFYYMTPMMVP
jgi:protease-4